MFSEMPFSYLEIDRSLKNVQHFPNTTREFHQLFYVRRSEMSSTRFLPHIPRINHKDMKMYTPRHPRDLVLLSSDAHISIHRIVRRVYDKPIYYVYRAIPLGLIGSLQTNMKPTLGGLEGDAVRENVGCLHVAVVDVFDGTWVEYRRIGFGEYLECVIWWLASIDCRRTTIRAHYIQ